MNFEEINAMSPEELADLIFEEELPRCPFCGGEPSCLDLVEKMNETFGESFYPKAILETLNTGFVECSECHANVSGRTMQEAKEKWMRRVSNEK